MNGSFRKFVFVTAALLAASCTQQPEVERMPNGAIRYAPIEDEAIRPDVETSKFVYADVIVDKVTGYRLSQKKGWFSVSGFGHHLTLWRLDRSKEKKPAIFFLTKAAEDNGNWFSRRLGLEIIHANADGFFPFRDALYQSDFSFERVAAMLDRYKQKEKPKFLAYLDNRLAYREQSAAAQRDRDKSPFLRANFDYDPMAQDGATIYFPPANSASFDQRTNTAISSNGSTLLVTHGTWSTFPDRSGRLPEFRAEWSQEGARNRWIVRLVCLRTYRRGYGETRAVEVVGFERPTWRGIPIEIESPGPPPSGDALAALINASLPIAGPHVGHMVVVMSKQAESAAEKVSS